MSSFTQISLSIIPGNLQHMMPVSDSNQFYTLSVRPVPEQYPSILAMQGKPLTGPKIYIHSSVIHDKLMKWIGLSTWQ